MSKWTRCSENKAERIKARREKNPEREQRRQQELERMANSKPYWRR